MGYLKRVVLMVLLRYASSNSISLLTVTQPLSFDEEVNNTYQLILDTAALYKSQEPQMDPAWHAKFLKATALYAAELWHCSVSPRRVPGVGQSKSAPKIWDRA